VFPRPDALIRGMVVLLSSNGVAVRLEVRVGGERFAGQHGCDGTSLKVGVLVMGWYKRGWPGVERVEGKRCARRASTVEGGVNQEIQVGPGAVWWDLVDVEVAEWGRSSGDGKRGRARFLPLGRDKNENDGDPGSAGPVGR
jgi:hypothetical protein